MTVHARHATYGELAVVQKHENDVEMYMKSGSSKKAKGVKRKPILWV